MTRQKTKTCRVCKSPFIQTRPMQPVCSAFECKVEFAQRAANKSKRQREQTERAAYRAAKEKIKTRREWIKNAQTVFNTYIRLRDRGKDCISCGRPLGDCAIGGDYDAGHYRSVGSAPHLRFEPKNVNGQCKKCNRYGAGMAVDYRIGLIKRIGLDSVEAIESDQTSRKWSVEELKELISRYSSLIKTMKKESAK